VSIRHPTSSAPDPDRPMTGVLADYRARAPNHSHNTIAVTRGGRG
jgi:hypothetical protein